MNNTQHEDGKKLNGNSLFTIAIILLFAIVLVMSFSLTKTAGIVPRLISIIGIVLSVISLVTNFKNNDGKTNDNNVLNKNQGLSFVKCFGMLIAYLVAMIVLGFFTSTLLILFFMTILLKYKNYKGSIIFSIITSAILLFVFKNIFYVRLPVGILFELFL